jgi:hypothetical protein
MKEQQTPRDRVLWILGSNDGKLSINRLRSMVGLKKAGLDIVLEELKRENRIVIRHKAVTLKRFS